MKHMMNLAEEAAKEAGISSTQAVALLNATDDMENLMRMYPEEIDAIQHGYKCRIEELCE